MNRAQLEDLDRFLAVADIAGERFGRYSLLTCGLGAWAIDRGVFAGIAVSNFDGLAYTRIAQALGTTCTRLEPAWNANDASGGRPDATRAALQAAFPEVFLTPMCQEVTP